MERFIRIHELIPVGQRNAISRENLCIKAKMSDREVRKLIEMSDVLIINLGNGYFIPEKNERNLVRQYRHQELSRLLGNGEKIRKIDRWLRKDEDLTPDGEQINISEFMEI